MAKIQLGMDREKVMNIGIRWLFWRCKKVNKKEILLMTFALQVVDIGFFASATIALVVSVLVGNSVYVGYVFLVESIYFLFFGGVLMHYRKKYKARSI